RFPMKRSGPSRAIMWWFLLTLGLLHVTATQTTGKRAGEELQYGNQQNLPIALLDDTFAVPGAFASSESQDSLESVQTTVGSKEEGGDDSEAHSTNGQTVPLQKQQHQQKPRQQVLQKPPSVGPSGYPPVLGANLPLTAGGMQLVRDWGSPHMFASRSLPTRRRRAVTVGRPNFSSYHPGGLMSMGRRPKRTFQRRYRRDLTAGDLDTILREVDVVELLQALGRGQQHQQPRMTYPSLGFGQQSPRFAPQPALFPEYREEPEPASPPPPGTVGRIWRRSGFSSGLSRVPGFKRSSPPVDLSDYTERSNDDEVYSLAAMLGAESDPRTQRIRRVAM
ncbi:unnamed protein product, partial [Meganyctiphanes norvegica]